MSDLLVSNTLTVVAFKQSADKINLFPDEEVEIVLGPNNTKTIYTGDNGIAQSGDLNLKQTTSPNVDINPPVEKGTSFFQNIINKVTLVVNGNTTIISVVQDASELDDGTGKYEFTVYGIGNPSKVMTPDDLIAYRSPLQGAVIDLLLGTSAFAVRVVTDSSGKAVMMLPPNKTVVGTVRTSHSGYFQSNIKPILSSPLAGGKIDVYLTKNIWF
ncbi:hypothetical protein [Longirhabdus pacifica]|uniref:hypothetical protein n=1 Tax=Longirhabdus pacifica TaxID=2305227 RepID=UPI0010092C07|nr:hypothetical protein [Longirhabdus pacifica]